MKNRRLLILAALTLAACTAARFTLPVRQAGRVTLSGLVIQEHTAPYAQLLQLDGESRARLRGHLTGGAFSRDALEPVEICRGDSSDYHAFDGYRITALGNVFPSHETQKRDVLFRISEITDARPVPVFVNVQMDGQRKSLELFHFPRDFSGPESVVNPRDRVELYEDGNLIQAIDLSGSLYDTCYAYSRQVEDLNFDGSDDLMFDIGGGALGSSFLCYLWNPSTGRYEENASLAGVINPSADAAQKRVVGYERQGPTEYFTRFFRWRGDRLYLSEIQFDDSDFAFPAARGRDKYALENGVFHLAESEITFPEQPASLPDSGLWRNPWPGRAASPFTPPEITHPLWNRLAGTDGTRFLLLDRYGFARWQSVFDFAWAHNESLLLHGGGASPADLASLREHDAGWQPNRGRCLISTGKFVRLSDLERVGKYLYGDGYEAAWRDEEQCGSDPAFLTSYLNTYFHDFVNRELFLSLTESNGSLLLESLPVVSYCDAGLYQAGSYPMSVPEMKERALGYLSGGQIFLYDDLELSSLRRNRYTLRPAPDGHFTVTPDPENL